MFLDTIAPSVCAPLAAVSLGAWAGAIALLSFVVAPTTFRNLSPPPPKFLHQLFSRYYLLGEIFSGLAFLGAAPFIFVIGRDGFPWAVEAALMAVVVACFAISFYSRHSLTPAIQRFRGSEEHKGQFDQLHKRSVRLNSLMLFASIAGSWLATRLCALA